MVVETDHACPRMYDISRPADRIAGTAHAAAAPHLESLPLHAAGWSPSAMCAWWALVETSQAGKHAAGRHPLTAPTCTTCMRTKAARYNGPGTCERCHPEARPASFCPFCPSRVLPCGLAGRHFVSSALATLWKIFCPAWPCARPHGACRGNRRDMGGKKHGEEVMGGDDGDIGEAWLQPDMFRCDMGDLIG